MSNVIKNELVAFVLDAEATDLNIEREALLLMADNVPDELEVVKLKARADGLNQAIGRIYVLKGLLS